MDRFNITKYVALFRCETYEEYSLKLNRGHYVKKQYFMSLFA